MLFNHCANTSWTWRWSGNALWSAGRSYYVNQFLNMLVKENLKNNILLQQNKKKTFTPVQSHWIPANFNIWIYHKATHMHPKSNQNEDRKLAIIWQIHYFPILKIVSLSYRCLTFLVQKDLLSSHRILHQSNRRSKSYSIMHLTWFVVVSEEPNNIFRQDW